MGIFVLEVVVVVTRVDGEQKVETYVGVSAPPWKSKYSGHKSSFTNPNKKGETKLSTHIWELKARGSTFDVKWKVIDRGAPFTPVTGRCNLCTKEKFYILRKPEMASLNSRKEQNMQNMHIAYYAEYAVYAKYAKFLLNKQMFSFSKYFLPFLPIIYLMNQNVIKTKVQCPHSISRTCLAQEFGLVLCGKSNNVGINL